MSRTIEQWCKDNERITAQANELHAKAEAGECTARDLAQAQALVVERMKILEEMERAPAQPAAVEVEVDGTRIKFNDIDQVGNWIADFWEARR